MCTLFVTFSIFLLLRCLGLLLVLLYISTSCTEDEKGTWRNKNRKASAQTLYLCVKNSKISRAIWSESVESFITSLNEPKKQKQKQQESVFLSVGVMKSFSGSYRNKLSHKRKRRARCLNSTFQSISISSFVITVARK